MSEGDSKNGNPKKKMTDGVRQYIEKRLELFSLTIAEQVSQIIAESFQQIMGMFILSFALFFLWFAVGFFVGDLIGNISAGFAISATPLFLIGYLLMNSHSKRITEKVQAQLISKVIDNLEDEKESKKIEGKTVEQK